MLPPTIAPSTMRKVFFRVALPAIERLAVENRNCLAAVRRAHNRHGQNKEGNQREQGFFHDAKTG